MRFLSYAIVVGALALVVACGDGGARDGDRFADSASHWLMSCDADDECGDASCICGICTQTCADDGACGADAICAPASVACGADEPAVCAATCSTDPDCADGLACVEGACVVPREPVHETDAGDAGMSPDADDAGDVAVDADEDGLDTAAPDSEDAHDATDSVTFDAGGVDTAADATDASDARADGTDDVDSGSDVASDVSADTGGDATDGGGGPEVPVLVCSEGEPRWEVVPLPATGPFNAWALDVDAGVGPVHVLVGYQDDDLILGPRTYRVLRWNGADWDDLGEPDVTALELEALGTQGVVWESLAVGPDGEVWLGGDAELGPLGPGRGYQLPVTAVWRDGAWSDPESIELATVTVDPFSPRGGSIFDMEVLDDGTVYAVGQSSGWGGLSENNGSLPMVLRNEGSGWVERNVADRDWPGTRGSTYASSVVSPDGMGILAVGRHPGGGAAGDGAIVLIDDPTDGPTFVHTPAGGSEPTGTAARNVAARSDADIWVVGDGTSVATGLLMHFDGTTWSIVDPGLPVQASLGAIALTGGDTAWALPWRTRTYDEGSMSYATHAAARFDGDAWTPFDLDAALGGTLGMGIYDSVVGSDGEIWIAGYAYGAPSAAPSLPPAPMVAAWRCPTEVTDRAVGRLVDVPAGTFEMGCDPDRDDIGDGCNADELPLHTVMLTRSLQAMESEVTQGMWMAQFGNNPAFHPGCGADCPVERVNWWEALAFANAASEADGRVACYVLEGCVRTPGTDLDCTSYSVTPASGDVRDCAGYRLPTEAEWEYLARGGASHAWAGSDDPDAVAWHYDISSTRTHPVCLKARNGFGLCDMSGNVWEWTSSLRYDYPDGPVVDPVGGTASLEYVFRGGHWNLDASWARVARRFSDFPGFQAFGLGFRLVRTAD